MGGGVAREGTVDSDASLTWPLLCILAPRLGAWRTGDWDSLLGETAGRPCEMVPGRPSCGMDLARKIRKREPSLLKR